LQNRFVGSEQSKSDRQTPHVPVLTWQIGFIGSLQSKLVKQATQPAKVSLVQIGLAGSRVQSAFVAHSVQNPALHTCSVALAMAQYCGPSSLQFLHVPSGWQYGW
jgi:hypothetical protein